MPSGRRRWFSRRPTWKSNRVTSPVPAFLSPRRRMCGPGQDSNRSRRKIRNDLHLSGTLKNAELVRVNGIAENYALLDTGKADVIAATKTALFARSTSRPSREF